MKCNSKMFTILAAAALTLGVSCSSDDPNTEPDPVPTPGGEGVSDVRAVKSQLDVDLATDRAVYSPGEEVNFTASAAPSGAKIRYRHGSEVVAEVPMSGTSWSWNAPADDFKGYLVEVYTVTENDEDLIHGTIAVDVSSDWTRFPRYGFVATFGNEKLGSGVIESEMEYLNRCHINGVQFQDWHNKHHWPLGGTRDKLDETYRDIANRTIYTAAVKKYIEVQHAYGMKSIFYNLAFGALDDAASDGVKDEWGVFKGRNRTDRDAHYLPNSWKSNIYLTNPGNTEWQQYLAQRNDDVYANFDFDGYQIDQLGNRGDLYDYYSNRVDMPSGYASFINAMKAAHPGKRLIMNAVSSYGASEILGTGKVDFAYNEVWGDEADFADLRNIIRANERYSDNGVRTVFAAYMNYDKADRTTGYMNTPGVILTDAVMMALGGAHLELGDHMLSREYFPASPLAMDDELREAMIHYYDFFTAYQNILRGTTTADEYTPSVQCTNDSKRITFANWPPATGKITTYARRADGKDYIHLINCRNLDNTSWRDLNGDRPAPRLTLETPVSVGVDKTVKRVWTASPDFHGGAPVELAFEQADGKVTFTLPSLKYWAMIVIE